MTEPDPLAVANDQPDNRMTPRRVTTRTGVILGLAAPVTAEFADLIHDQLRIRYPGVVFALVPGATSVTFTFDDPS